MYWRGWRRRQWTSRKHWWREQLRLLAMISADWKRCGSLITFELLRRWRRHLECRRKKDKRRLFWRRKGEGEDGDFYVDKNSKILSNVKVVCRNNVIYTKTFTLFDSYWLVGIGITSLRRIGTPIRPLRDLHSKRSLYSKEAEEEEETIFEWFNRLNWSKSHCFSNNCFMWLSLKFGSLVFHPLACWAVNNVFLRSFDILPLLNLLVLLYFFRLLCLLLIFKPLSYRFKLTIKINFDEIILHDYFFHLYF